MSRAVFPGSFDPVTNGHMDLIRRSAGMFDEVVIGVLHNYSKQPLFSVKDRVSMLESLVDDLPGISVKAFDGLLVDFVREQQACAVIRGLRTASDFEYELPMAQLNYRLCESADTVFLATSPEHSYVSSSAVRELLHYQTDVRDLVPQAVYEKIIKL